MKKFVSALVCLAFLAPAAPALAHFQIIYTPEMAMKEGGKIDLALVFSHPFDAGRAGAIFRYSQPG